MEREQFEFAPIERLIEEDSDRKLILECLFFDNLTM